MTEANLFSKNLKKTSVKSVFDNLLFFGGIYRACSNGSLGVSEKCFGVPNNLERVNKWLRAHQTVVNQRPESMVKEKSFTDRKLNRGKHSSYRDKYLKLIFTSNLVWQEWKQAWPYFLYLG